MAAIDKFSVAMLFLGMGVGTLVPGFPAPLDMLNSSLTLVFFLIGVLFLVLR